MRLARFLIIIGVTLVLLSYISPIVDPSYSTDFGLDPGKFRGYVVNCNSELDIRITSSHEEPFTVYFMTYENGYRALEEGSLENVTILQIFSNTTSLSQRLSIPSPGWYAILVTPSTNETIRFLEIDFGKQIPNQGLVVAGASFLIVGILYFLIASRKQSVLRTHSKQ
ncbi:MAG: hypothetical protein E4H14_12680 [Candidatus Thorarchaeota archaeon]|nr:MAG: hypothetical protein E4H14_12680 [Candidatus Thorarchaeota archaeon]